MIALNAIFAASIHQYARPDDIRTQENLGIFDGAIHVGFRCEVDNNIRLLALKERVDCCAIRNVTAHERELRILLRRVERCKIARIGQRIIADDLILGMLTQLVVDKVCTDKSSAARHNNLHRLRSFFFST